MSDQRQVAVEHAVKVAALVRLAREIGIAESLAVVANAAIGGAKNETATPREIAAAARHDHRATVVAEIMRLERDGRGRAAAMIVARSNAADARDPIEVETLANKYRRWRRSEKQAHTRLLGRR